jgi:hypothetical protein
VLFGKVERYGFMVRQLLLEYYWFQIFYFIIGFAFALRTAFASSVTDVSIFVAGLLFLIRLACALILRPYETLIKLAKECVVGFISVTGTVVFLAIMDCSSNASKCSDYNIELCIALAVAEACALAFVAVKLLFGVKRHGTIDDLWRAQQSRNRAAVDDIAAVFQELEATGDDVAQVRANARVRALDDAVARGDVDVVNTNGVARVSRRKMHLEDEHADDIDAGRFGNELAPPLSPLSRYFSLQPCQRDADVAWSSAAASNQDPARASSVAASNGQNLLVALPAVVVDDQLALSAAATNELALDAFADVWKESGMVLTPRISDVVDAVEFENAFHDDGEDRAAAAAAAAGPRLSVDASAWTAAGIKLSPRVAEVYTDTVDDALFDADAEFRRLSNLVAIDHKPSVTSSEGSLLSHASSDDDSLLDYVDENDPVLPPPITAGKLADVPWNASNVCVSETDEAFLRRLSTPAEIHYVPSYSSSSSSETTSSSDDDDVDVFAIVAQDRAPAQERTLRPTDDHIMADLWRSRAAR